jgi:hypothetical protein
MYYLSGKPKWSYPILPKRWEWDPPAPVTWRNCYRIARSKCLEAYIERPSLTQPVIYIVLSRIIDPLQTCCRSSSSLMNGKDPMSLGRLKMKNVWGLEHGCCMQPGPCATWVIVKPDVRLEGFTTQTPTPLNGSTLFLETLTPQLWKKWNDIRDN